ncbi:hypothetical protein EUGRSUZ_E00974 [Eucalyptus grandis]|uniref:Uncharacterized protein n=2 Tax=Eucalyptus grandis TaxID=71139 RepID=A0ACC3KPP5_EUCGR|nr:hypothetical protein EUGRSUZ_E00974 [Eucalyptus grandis]
MGRRMVLNLINQPIQGDKTSGKVHPARDSVSNSGISSMKKHRSHQESSLDQASMRCLSNIICPLKTIRSSYHCRKFI